MGFLSLISLTGSRQTVIDSYTGSICEVDAYCFPISLERRVTTPLIILLKYIPLVIPSPLLSFQLQRCQTDFCLCSLRYLQQPASNMAVIDAIKQGILAISYLQLLATAVSNSTLPLLRLVSTFYATVSSATNFPVLEGSCLLKVLVFTR